MLTLQGQPVVKAVAEEQGSLRISVDDGEAALPELMRVLDAQRLAVSGISLTKATLDDVFLEKTGRSLRDTAAAEGGRS
jgi:ABC-2 type transport system ATP-binding protein